MAPAMPGKLMVVLGVMALGAVLSLVAGDVVAAVLGIVLIVGVIAGNDGVRTFLRGLAAVQILWALIAFMVLADTTPSAGEPALLLAGILAFGSPAFLIWALGQNDVREWMFRKNFKLDDGDDPPQP